MIKPRRYSRMTRGGFSGLSGPPSPVGYGTYDAYHQAVLATFEDCGIPADSACVDRNQARMDAANNAWTSDPNSCHNVVCGDNGLPIQGIVVSTDPNPARANVIVPPSSVTTAPSNQIPLAIPDLTKLIPGPLQTQEFGLPIWGWLVIGIGALVIFKGR